MDGHFQASCLLQPVGCLFYSDLVCREMKNKMYSSRCGQVGCRLVWLLVVVIMCCDGTATGAQAAGVLCQVA